MTPPAKQVCILGESPLLEEFASLCLHKGLAVTTRAQDGSHPDELPHEIKKTRGIPKTTDIALELTNTSVERKKRNLVALDEALPAGIPILSSSVIVTTAQQAKWISKPGRLIGFAAFPSLLDGGLIEFAPSPATLEPTKIAAKEFARSLGKESAFVRDRIGLVMPRILCMLANETYFALGEKLALRQDIDAAMKLGAGYPTGPAEWTERIGARQIRAVLEALSKQVDKQRYRLAPLLRQAATRRAVNRK